MKLSTNKYYQVKELTMYNVITIVIQEYAAFSKNKLLNIRLLNANFAEMIPKLQQWLQIYFTSLREPRLNSKVECRLIPIDFVWQTLPWPILAMIWEDSSDRWVASIWASIETHIQP
jgi:hypothetical protein